MKKPVMISILCVAAAAILLFWGFRPDSAPQEAAPAQYALVVASDTGTFLMQLRKGMQAAADEAGVSLAVLNINEAIPEGDYQALLVLSSTVPPALSHVPKLYINQTVHGAWCVIADDNAIAAQLLERALSLAPPESIAVVCDGEDNRSAIRSAMARRLATEQGMQVITYAQSAPELPSGCTVAVAMSRRATVALSELKRSGHFTGAVLGMDTGDTRVTDLEDGAITVMALDNPYAMGYIAMQRAIEGVALTAEQQSVGFSPEPITVSLLAADLENMYLPENVKQVFPLLQ